MTFLKKASCLLVAIASTLSAISQSDWPKEIPLQNGGKITIYQPQPESYSGNRFSSRSAVAVKKSAGDDPIFGAIWTDAILQTDKDSRMATLESITIRDARFPNIEDSNEVLDLKETLESEIPKWNIQLSLDEIVSSLDQQNTHSADGLKNDPPEIIYSTQPSALVLIDGDPIVTMDNDLHMQRVNNSPFVIVKNPDDNKYYLYGGKFWYNSASLTSGWKPVAYLPRKIQDLDTQLKQQKNDSANNGTNTNKSKDYNTPPAIIVRTSPAELLQTQGEPQYTPVQGTSLLYVSNTDNDLFKDINSQDNYVLLSGRWYKSKSLNGPWEYVDASQLPPDYAKIPEGSEKDNVLASVPGTDESREAVLDATIPQTAKVDRNSATTSVEYDGDPSFEPVQGTNLQYATNTSGTVILDNATYYAVDNGVWFVSDRPNGPWHVATERPHDIERVPPSCPVYNTRYVYIYDMTPDYVWMGYTPGYLNSFIYGRTVVYGTGWYYRHWWRRRYYPRPLTWGFGMHYNPWSGFCISIGFTRSFVNFIYATNTWRGWHGGWFGPVAYRPAYRPVYRYNGVRVGYYGVNSPYGRPRTNGSRVVIQNNITINNNVRVVNNRNNLYNNQRGIVTRDVNRRPGQSFPSGNYDRRTTFNNNNNQNNQSNRLSNNNNVYRPANNYEPSRGNTVMPGRQPKASREPNNVFTDRNGNIYQRDQSGNIQNRDKSGWRPATKENTPSLPQMQQQTRMRERGEMRTNNFRQQNSNNNSSTTTGSRPVRQATNNNNNSGSNNSNKGQQGRDRGGKRGG